MFGDGFKPSSGNPVAGVLRLIARLATTKFTIWRTGFDHGDQWIEATVYIGKRFFTKLL